MNEDFRSNPELEKVAIHIASGDKLAFSRITLHVLHALANRIHATAKEKGWWDDGRNDGELIALIHSELSEALEGLRHGNQPSEHIPEFNAAEEELADAIIRILDMGEARGWRIPEAIFAKMEFNSKREHRHGGKKF